MLEIVVELVEGVAPPLFRLTASSGQVVKLLEISVSEVGEDEPHWRVVHELAMLDGLVEAGIISPSEAEGNRVAVLRFHDESLLEQTAIPMQVFRYGDVPQGMRQVGLAKSLARGRLYKVLVSGNGHGELQFYA